MEQQTVRRPQKQHSDNGNGVVGTAPPHSSEAEQALLGGLIIDSEAINKVAGMVKPDDFYVIAHKAIFKTILDLYENNTPIDLVTVSALLTDKGQLVNIGGVLFLNKLVDAMPTSAGIEAYARIVKEKSTMRSIMEAAGKIHSMGYSEQEMGAREYLDRAEMLIFSIEGEREYKKAKKVYEILLDGVPKLEMLWKKQSKITGVPTGFHVLDNMTAGFQPSDLIIIAGRPSMGKTALALNMARAAAENEVPAGIFSLEMSQEQLSMRLLATETEVSFSRIRTGAINENEWRKLGEGTFKFEQLPIFIDDSPALNILDLRGRARRMVKEHNIGIIFIDYLQLIRGKQENNRFREQEISEISRFLKALAKELNIPVVALSQLNRKVEERPEKKPILSDLRESGAIEQDADVILFLYRDEVYNKESEDAGIAEINIGKQRNGSIGGVKIGYQSDCTRFFNLYEDAGELTGEKRDEYVIEEGYEGTVGAPTPAKDDVFISDDGLPEI